MSVYSMTGFASGRQSPPEDPVSRAVDNDATVRLVIELRSVNSRFLDLSFRLPDELRQHEPALRAALTQRLKRGKIELRATIEGRENTDLGDLPVALLQRLASLQDKVRSWLPDAIPLSVADIIRVAGATGVADEQVLADSVLPLAQQVLGDLLAARAREGARLAALLQTHVTELRALTRQAAPLVPQVVRAQRQRFLARWDEALGVTDGQIATAAAHERALAEAAAFSIRIDVTEELDRLTAHLDEIDAVLAKGGEVGKRLDFLIQELHREANTLGSKSAALELSRIGVDMKVRIEQMREQVQNIE